MYAQLKLGLLHVHVALDCSEICITLKHFKLARTLLLLSSSFLTCTVFTTLQSNKTVYHVRQNNSNKNNISWLAFDICSYRLFPVPVLDNIALLDYDSPREFAHVLF